MDAQKIVSGMKDENNKTHEGRHFRSREERGGPSSRFFCKKEGAASSTVPSSPADATTTTLALAEPSRSSSPSRAGHRSSSHRRHGGGNGAPPAVFTTSRPAHVGSGLASGVWNVVKGVALGARALVTAPVAGAINEGASGFAKGAMVGVVAAVAYPIAGVATGVHQIGFGVINTPEALRESGHGKVYDGSSGVWVDRYRVLDEEFAECQVQHAKTIEQAKMRNLASASSMSERKDGEKQKRVADSTYYDVLGVSPDATQAEIRKAYYRLARENHPDKQLDAPQEAKQKFQTLGEAYQVLGEPTRRAQYDKHGKAATEKMEFIDASVFFAMLFGSEALEPYVGKLRLASVADFELSEDESEANATKSAELMREEQAFREVDLAVKLRDRLQPYVQARKEGKEEGVLNWTMEQRKVAEKLCGQSFGSPLVDALGFVYENYADQFIGKRQSVIMFRNLSGKRDTFLQYKGTMAKLEHQKRQFGTYYSALQAATRATKSAKKVRKKHGANGNSPPPDDNEMTSEEIEAMEKSLGHILQTMLQLCIADLHATVRSASKKTLNDKGVDETEQRFRAEGLKLLGQIFQQASQEAVSTPLDAREQMHEAYIKTAQKMDERQHGGSPSA